MLKNYFKPTSKNIEKILLGLKTLIGTVAVSTFFQGDVKVGFYFLLSGAVVDFLLRCTSEDPSDKSQNTQQ